MPKDIISVLLVFFFIIVAHKTIDARAIQHDTIDYQANDPAHETEELLATLTNYQYNFEHSNNIKAIRWMLQQDINAGQVSCKVCHILVPIVSHIASFSHIHRWSLMYF